MKSTKLLTTALFTLAASYTGFSFYTTQLATQPTICQNPVFGALAPWDSGCFYRALYQEEISLVQLSYEKYKLDKFVANGGFAHTVLWYRAQFHQRFKDFFGVGFDEIEQMHKDYSSSDPSNVSTQVAYWEYLVNNNQELRAQESLNHYCDTYLTKQRAYLIPALEEVFGEKGIELSLKNCKQLLGS